VFLPDGTFLPLPKLACPPKPWRRWATEPFLERRQTAVIEKILRHCGLWEESPARRPFPAAVAL
jgi:hypothetical protein